MNESKDEPKPAWWVHITFDDLTPSELYGPLAELDEVVARIREHAGHHGAYAHVFHGDQWVVSEGPNRFLLGPAGQRIPLFEPEPAVPPQPSRDGYIFMEQYARKPVTRRSKEEQDPRLPTEDDESPDDFS